MSQGPSKNGIVRCALFAEDIIMKRNIVNLKTVTFFPTTTKRQL